MELEIIKDESFDENKVSKYIIEESIKYFGNDMTVTILFIQKLQSKNKKEKDFESFIKDINE